MQPPKGPQRQLLVTWTCPWPGGRVSSAAAEVPECRLFIPLTQNRWRSKKEEEGCFEAGGLCLGL